MTTAEGARQAVVGRLTGGLEGKVAIVTGSTRGIGYAIAEDLAALGVTVIICSRKQADVNNAVSAMQAKGLDVHGTAVDITEPAGRQTLLKQAEAINGKLDILVNNAGILDVGPTESFPLEQQQQVFKINQEAVLALTAAAHPLLKASGSAAIIMISSIGGGPLAVESCAAYAMSKGAMDNFTKYLAVEWARDFLASEDGQKVLTKIPQKRVAAVTDMSGLAVFLASASARHMTGQLITVDGGHSVFGAWRDRP